MLLLYRKLLLNIFIIQIILYVFLVYHLELKFELLYKFVYYFINEEYGWFFFKEYLRHILLLFLYEGIIWIIQIVLTAYTAGYFFCFGYLLLRYHGYSLRFNTVFDPLVNYAVQNFI